ncbi:LysR family transcriptional regulator [Mangrovitalea sediminis]|uniref:LysR family transcriptional regulator n=1 Tax=Mangrovitalea sediminis TaxID=1982043 RepID=UPI000BE598EA|nr:LysR family transcriptional regulator [Mangrovitalea sediminis]
MHADTLNWSDIRVFLAIVRAGTLGGGARELGLTQPTMGRRIKALESTIGQKLFQRTADGFVLTDEGAAILPHAQRMEEQALALSRQIDGSGNRLDGLLRVSSSDWFGVYVVAPLFAEFSQRHPDVSLELITDARRLNLARREADLAFRITPFDEPDIAQRQLMIMAYSVYAANDWCIEQLDNPRQVRLITMDSHFGELPDVVWLKKMLPGARIAFASNNREAQARLCAAGVGLAVLPKALGDQMPGLKPVDLGEPPPSRQVWLGYHQDLRHLPRLRAFLDLTLKRLGQAS